MAGQAHDADDDLLDDEMEDTGGDESLVDARDEAEDILDGEFDGIAGLEDDEGRTDDVVEGVDADDLDEEVLDDDEDATPVAGADRGDGRDTKGKFAAGDKASDKSADKSSATSRATSSQAAPVASDATATGGDKAGATSGDKPAADSAPKWEKLSVTVEGKAFEIPDAMVAEGNGYKSIAIKADRFPAFVSRYSKAVQAERMWRQLTDGIKALDAEKAAPQARSDTEIEAQLTLEMMKPFLEQVFTEEQLANLELRVKLAQRDARDQHTTDRKKYFDDLTEQERSENASVEDEGAQADGMARQIMTVFKEHSGQGGDLHGMTEQELRAAWGELVPLSRAVFWKEKDGWYANNELILKTLKSRKGTAAAAPPPTPAPAGTTGNGSSGQSTKDAKRFNSGQESAANPTTSVKAKRDDSRPRDERHHRDPNRRNRRERQRDPAQVAEDAVRKTTKNWMRSDSLDLPDDDG